MTDEELELLFDDYFLWLALQPPTVEDVAELDTYLLEQECPFSPADTEELLKKAGFI